MYSESDKIFVSTYDAARPPMYKFFFLSKCSTVRECVNKVGIMSMLNVKISRTSSCGFIDILECSNIMVSEFILILTVEFVLLCSTNGVFNIVPQEHVPSHNNLKLHEIYKSSSESL
eukprot:NODE_382_length_9640_cov_0.243476.p5 type:complete len:117 gc:universal NODE_382_length_9640_cov_0.243476:5350-5000(-)